MGMDPQLDDELTALAAANRRSADALELESWAKSLTTAVVAVDATSPVPQLVLAPLRPKQPRPTPYSCWTSTCNARAVLLEGLKTGESDPEAV